MDDHSKQGEATEESDQESQRNGMQDFSKLQSNLKEI